VIKGRAPRQKSSGEELEAEIEDLRPYLGLAREIRDEVARLAAGDADGLALAGAIEAIPLRERSEIAREVFARLTPVQQWEVLERAYGDEELRTLLESERAAVLANEEAISARRALAHRAEATGSIDTREVPKDERLTLGLFVEADVQVARELGPRSSRCARRVVLQARGDDGRFIVIEDVFNPEAGYYVTPGYDQQTWRDERLRPYEVVRIGSLKPTFDPVVHLGGRVDFEREGRLHLGYALVGDIDLFNVNTGKGNR
jgi:hypothetical protein